MDFTPPILLKGPGFDLREIRTVSDAADWLQEWPVNARSPFWYLASNALQGVRDGTMSVADAREAFEAFCNGAGLLLA